MICQLCEVRYVCVRKTIFFFWTSHFTDAFHTCIICQFCEDSPIVWGILCMCTWIFVFLDESFHRRISHAVYYVCESFDRWVMSQTTYFSHLHDLTIVCVISCMWVMWCMWCSECCSVCCGAIRHVCEWCGVVCGASSAAVCVAVRYIMYVSDVV